MPTREVSGAQPPGLMMDLPRFPHDRQEIPDQSLGINRPSFWAIIAAKDSLFSDPSHNRNRGD